MSRKEVPRAGLLKAALAGKITNAQGALALHLSVRQFQRLKRRYAAAGAPGLLHRLRARPSPRRLGPEVRAHTLLLLQTRYGDRFGVFVRNDTHWTLEEELRGTQDPTHFGRILQDLGIDFIAAHSPQAKGRIERFWQTLQDRLVSELRLRGISSPEAANAFLPAFLADLTPRFARAPADAPPPGAPPRARSPPS